MPRQEAVLRGSAAAQAIASEAAAAATEGAVANLMGGTDDLIKNIAIQAGISAATAIGQQLAKTACPRRRPRQQDHQGEEELRTYSTSPNIDKHGGIIDKTCPATPVKPVHHNLDYDDSENSRAKDDDEHSMEFPDLGNLDTEQRRKKADTILEMLQEDSMERRAEWQRMKEKMEAIDRQLMAMKANDAVKETGTQHMHPQV